MIHFLALGSVCGLLFQNTTGQTTSKQVFISRKCIKRLRYRVVRHDDFFGNLSANPVMHYVDFHPKVLKHLSFGFSIPKYYQT